MSQARNEQLHAQLVRELTEHFLSVACPICSAPIGEVCTGLAPQHFHVERGTGETTGHIDERSEVPHE